MVGTLSPILGEISNLANPAKYWFGSHLFVTHLLLEPSTVTMLAQAKPNKNNAISSKRKHALRLSQLFDPLAK